MRKPIFTPSRCLAGAFAITALALGGCATSPRGPETVIATPASAAPGRTLIWPIKTREHVDLWLHGFAMLTNDSSTVPLFRRGYRDEMVVYKNQANVLTQLDVNIDRLRERMAGNPRIIDAQFVALYFESLEEMQATITAFVGAGGNPQAAQSERQAVAFMVLRNYFSSQADQSWLALFASSLWDESAKFYQSYWKQQQRARANVIDSVQSAWDNLMRPRIQRYLNNTKQSRGDILLSMPLGGEGRTMSGEGNQRGIITVSLPARPSDAAEALYGIAHEIVAPAVHSVVSDNVTPAQERAGYGNQLRSIGAVRGGLILLEQLVPELAEGYARYYVQVAGQTPGDAPRAQLAKLFPIPEGMARALVEQIDNVQGGI